ncbi:phosphate/phosphite/phosphonate ABC transporter substrate-binding protein [Geitlerinema sp. PCC 9228]|jgi:phosphonate transport system substrate-binding protein|uniref:phosphate/phosphite/phosphonate ABC transporter substrate-binding protein n=1 Tax=Geitlerinema sp. PCC 9228 TaxID=111611 RepID=UPI0008F99F8F|nr:phosphate/phosphite/phosphonate ABC transporter substrate-binding protein [Geitlerinema sp. PCC 9228]
MKRRHFLWYSFLFLSGCGTAVTNNTNNASNSSASSNAQKPLRFTVTDVQGLENLKQQYEPFRQAWSQVLQQPVEFVPVNGYTEAAAALRLDRVDIALSGPSEYVLIRTRTEATPIVAITRPNYHSAVVVPAESPIQSLDELKNKEIAMREIGSTSGHIGPTGILLEAGLDPKTDYQAKMLGDRGSLAALANREVDAWAGPWLDYQQFLQRENISADDYRMVKKGPPLPNDVFMASSFMDKNTIADIRDRTLANQQKLIDILATREKKYEQSQLVAAQDTDYDPIRNVYRAIGQGDFLNSEGQS